MRLSRLAGVCRLGQRRARQHPRARSASHGRQKQRLLHSTCYLREAAALPSPSSSGKPWQRPDNIRFKICSCQVIDRGRKTSTWRERGQGFSLLNLWAKSRLVQWESRCQCFHQLLQDVILGHERRFEEHFAVMVADLLHFWLQLTAHSHPLSLILLVHRPGGNWNIFLLSHTPSSPWQQMGKYYSVFFNLQVDW